jgi:hypothetical protein
MRKCCEDADWREHAVKACSLKIRDAIARHPDFVNQFDKTKEIERMLSGSKCKVSPKNDIFALPANLNKSIYYSLIEHLLPRLKRHHQELTCYEKIELVLSTTHSNGYGRFAKYCISVLEHGDLPTEPLMKGFHEWCISQYGTVDGGQKDGSQTQARWSKGYALHELYGCRGFLEYILLCHTNKWTPTKAHAHLKTHIPHIGNLTANELAAVALWCNLQYHREYVTKTMIGSAVVKSVKDEWLEGKGENATVKIVIRDAGLDNGLLPFGTEQLACNLTHHKEELDIHVEDQTYTILSPFMVGVIKNAKWFLTLQGRGRLCTRSVALKKETERNGRNGGKMALGSTLRRGLSPQGPTITGGIGILIEKISPFLCGALRVSPA